MYSGKRVKGGLEGQAAKLRLGCQFGQGQQQLQVRDKGAAQVRRGEGGQGGEGRLSPCALLALAAAIRRSVSA